MKWERIQANVDPQTKRTLVRIANSRRISVSALLRIIAARLERGEITIDL